MARQPINHDPLGRLLATTNPVSGTTLYTDTATTLAQVRDPAGNVTSYGYDGADRLWLEADPDESDEDREERLRAI